MILDDCVCNRDHDDFERMLHEWEEELFQIEDEIKESDDFDVL